MSDQEIRYRNAKKRVEALKDFYVHAIVYVVINLLLFMINVLTTPNSLWFFWPLLGWGIGLTLHALLVFGGGRWFGAEWEERKINELMEQGGSQ